MSPFVVAIYFLVITLALFLAYRMTSLALRTRQLPEACIAGFAFGTAVGTFLLTIGRGIGALPEGWDVPVHAAGALLISIAAALLGLFTWRVFRPDAPWARRGFVALGALVLASLVASLTTPEDFRSHVRTPRSAASLVWLLARGVFFVWACREALHYWNAMRRRLALGLADPVVVNRFLLFGVWTAGMVGLWLNAVAARLLFHLTGGNASEPTLYLTGSVCGLVQIVSIWLAFFPPRAYLRRVARSAAPSPSGQGDPTGSRGRS